MDGKIPNRASFILRVAGLTALFIIILNLVFGLTAAEKWLGKGSLYSHVYPGRWRFPWSENPSAAYNVSTNNLDALYAAHEVSATPIPEDEFRVFFLGDSSTWGFYLPKEKTVSAYVNAAEAETPDGRPIRAYNLGYPTISLTKDLLLLSESLKYEPDLIVWVTTLEAFPVEKQIFTPLVEQNRTEVRALIETYDISIETTAEEFPIETFLDRSIFGRRRALANLFRLQLYGVLWSATGIDQDIPDNYTPLQSDYEIDDSYYSFSPPQLDRSRLMIDVLQAGIEMAGETPVLIVNEPIYISRGENSDIRYNFFYPRWAYDDYRAWMKETANLEGWYYADFWNEIPSENFTNTAIHFNAEGSQNLANLILLEIQDILENLQP
ncbi:MAG TPA: hypothetical protein VJ965_00275 [Anaerolineales bacterium]|nr:hypothetical protein [Anaerolineales bacterium]